MCLSTVLHKHVHLNDEFALTIGDYRSNSSVLLITEYYLQTKRDTVLK